MSHYHTPNFTLNAWSVQYHESFISKAKVFLLAFKQSFSAFKKDFLMSIQNYFQSPHFVCQTKLYMKIQCVKWYLKTLKNFQLFEAIIAHRFNIFKLIYRLYHSLKGIVGFQTIDYFERQKQLFWFSTLLLLKI